MRVEDLVAAVGSGDLRHADVVRREPAKEDVVPSGHIGGQDRADALNVSRHVAGVDRAAVRDEGHAPDLAVGLAANHIVAVADTDTRIDRRAVGQDEGVVVGGQADRLDLIADDCVLDFLVLGDVAVDEDTGLVACGILDHDGLDLALGLFDSGDGALDTNKHAEHGAVIDLRSRDIQRSRSLGVRDLFDLGHRDLALALIRGGRAGDADLIADLEAACNREGVDTGGVVLHIDAVEERGILVIAGGVGGHDALDGVLDALVLLRLYVGDLVDLRLVEHGQKVLADLVVGVILLRAVVRSLILDLEVRHEGRAGNDDQALALELLGRHDHQTVIIFREGVLRGSCAAKAVLVNVHGVGRRVAIDHGADRRGHRGGRVAAGVNRIDGGAAVVGGRADGSQDLFRGKRSV